MTLNGKKDLKPWLDKTIEISKRSGATIVIQGEAGTGKTYIIEKIAKERDWNIVMRVLSNSTIEEIVGVPVIHEDENGKKIFDKLIPKWLLPVYDTKNTKPLILFLDEINRRVVPEQILFAILDKKMVAGKKFKDNVILIACINSGKDYNVQELEDRAINNRLIKVNFNMNKNDIIKMIYELAENTEEKETSIVLNSIIPTITNTFGEFHNDYSSLRNWKNFYYYLCGKGIKSLDNLYHLLENDDYPISLISVEILDEIKSNIYQIISKTEELIDKFYKKKQKLSIENQFNAQAYFITNLLNCKVFEVEKLIKKMIVVLDNGIIIGTFKQVIPIVIDNNMSKNVKIITVLNMLGIMKKIKSAV